VLTHSLSHREAEVLAHLTDGHSNKEIAIALGISAATVKGYVERILAKLRVPNRAAAVAWWVRHTDGESDNPAE